MKLAAVRRLKEELLRDLQDGTLGEFSTKGSWGGPHLFHSFPGPEPGNLRMVEVPGDLTQLPEVPDRLKRLAGQHREAIPRPLASRSSWPR